MPDLTGTQISNTYKRLMQVNVSANSGITTDLQTIQSGDNSNTPLQLSNSTLNVNGTFAIGGVNLTATVSSINAISDISGGVGYIVVSGTNIYNRTFSAGPNITITNANGVASNTGIALTSAVNTKSVGATTVSCSTLEVTGSIDVSAVSVGTFTAVSVNTSVMKATSVSIAGGDATLQTGSIATFAATTVACSVLEGTTGTFTGVVSAAGFAGDGSQLTNVPSAEGGTVKRITAGTGIGITVNGSTSTSIPVSGTVLINPNQSFGTVSVSTGLVVPEGLARFSIPVSGTAATFSGNVSAANVYASTNVFVAGTAVPTGAQIAAVSALTSVNKADIATNVAAITSVNSVVAAVSALTSVNKAGVATNVAAITSVNSKIATVSGALATSIGNTNTVLAATSAALATSIGNSNTVIAAVSVLTSVNLAKITSINSVIGDGSGFATDAELQAVSATMATSIANSNTVIAAVSVLTGVNLAKITSINSVIGDGTGFATDAELQAVSATMATSIANSNTVIAAVSALTSVNKVDVAARLPLSGGTLTGILSATDVYTSAVAIGVDTLLGKQLHIGTAAVADIVSLTDGTNIAVDLNAGQNFAVQLGGNRTLSNPTNCVAGQTGSIFVIQDGTGSRTLSFAANYKFPGATAPTLTTTAGQTDRIDYIVFASANVHAIATLNVSTS
jgi:hypothetical protein